VGHPGSTRRATPYPTFSCRLSSGGTSADLKNQGFTIAAGYMIPFGH
jgi:hypothetical protein